MLVVSIYLITLCAVGSAAEKNNPWIPISRLETTLPSDLPTDASRADQLAYGIRLIGGQPRSDANIDAATRVLTALSADATDPELAAAAGYHLARLAQWARPNPQPLVAADQYLALNEKYPLTFHGQLALLRAIPIRCYLQDDAAQFRMELARLTSRARAIPRIEIKRTALAALAEAAHRRGNSPQEAAALSAEAATLPFDHRAIQSGILLNAATRAHAANQTAEAVEQLRRFLRDFPDDARAYEARTLLEEWTQARP